MLLIAAPVMASGQTVTAVWDASPASDQVTGYQVCIGTTSMSCNVQLASVSSTATSYTFTPTGGVIHYVAVRAVNPSGPGAYSAEASFSIPSFTQPVNQSSPVSVAITPLNFSVSDPDGSTLNYTHTGLPPGLAINATTGRITGTPSAAGTYNVTVFVADGLVTVSRSFVWTITQPVADSTAPALSITSHTNGQTVSSASATISGTATDSGRGGNGVASVTVNGAGATGGTVTGSATASWSRALTLSPGANTITVDASDTRGNVATQTITLNYTIAAVTSATLSSSVATPQNTGTTVTFTANAAGGVGPRQYKFLVQPSGGAAQMVRDWSTTTTYAWTPSTAANYTVIVWARSAGVTTDVAQAQAQMAYVINTPPPAPVTSATLTANLASPQNVDTDITFTANASGGVGPRQFKFFVQPGGGSAQMVRDWSTMTTYTWRPATAGNYNIIVWARSAGVTADSAQASSQTGFVVNTPPPAPVTSTTLSPSAASPQTTGTTVTFTAGATGGVGPRQFKFLVQQGSGAVQVAQTWSTATTFAWTPATAANYTVTVWARSAGVTTDAAQASAQVAYVINTPPPSPVTSATVSANLASPQNTGTAITFTAAAAGGVGPRQYKFFVQPNGGAAQMVRDWSTTTSFAWTPSTAASYTVTVWARSAGVTTDAAQAQAQMAYVINAPIAPVTSTTLSPSVASPQTTGTTVTFTAGATGGVGPRQFKFLVQQGSGAVQVAQTWSTATTFAWTPATAANYTVTVWARSAGVTTDAAQASAQVAYVINTAPPSPVTSATVSANLASPQNTGTAITFTAGAAGGVGPRQYKFFVQPNGGAAQMVRDWSTTTSFAWTPSTADSYTVTVWARSAGVTTDAAQAQAQMTYVINTPPPAPVASATLVANMASPQNTGTGVTFTAGASGGVGPRQYKFFVQPSGGAAQMVRDWSTTTTYTWTAATAGNYTVSVWARSAGVTTDAAQASAQVPYAINTPPPSPVTSASLSANLASPQNAGTDVTFTAGASGGVGPRQYKFFVQRSGGAAQVVRDWSATTTYTWTPATAGSYNVVVWARSAGVTTDAAQAFATMGYIVSTPPPAPVTSATLSSNLASPKDVGTAITLTAGATGGVGPRQYKFFVQPSGGAVQMVRDWSTTTSYTWTPSTAADYTVTVWARSAGVTADAAQASAQLPYVINTAPIAPVATATVTANLASPRNLGATVIFTANGSGGVGPRQYKFFVQQGGGAAQMVRDWSTTTTYTWTPASMGTYTVTVWARSAGVTVDAAQASSAVPYVISAAPAGPFAIAGLTPSIASPQTAGTPVTFTAASTGGTAPYSYKWWLFDGATWTMIRDWSTNATYTWTPVVGGSYRIGIWARDASTTADVSDVNLSIPYAVTGAVPTPPPAPAPTPTPTPGPVSITGLTSNLASPQVSGTPITFTAAATGGTAPHQFKWWIYNGATWTMVRDWSSATTYSWTPTSAGAYRVGIWARDASTTADVSDVNLSIPFTVTGAAPAPAPPSPPAPTPSTPLVLNTLVADHRSPEAAGTTVTFTAGATGGTAPYQYKWWLFDGSTWTVIADWGSSNTFAWSPLVGGSYRIGVWVRDSTTTADVGNVNLSVPFVVTAPNGLTLANIGLSTPVPVRGQAVGLTAFATGGVAPYQYKWWVFDGTTWTMLRDWGSSTITWTPPSAGNYRVGAWVRSAGSSDNSGSVNLSIPVVVQ